MMNRRRWMLSGFALLAAAPVAAQGRSVLEVWRDPYCGCCGTWVAHMRAAGFTVQDHVLSELGPVRRMLGTPPDLLSCHAARTDGLVLEGHVPAAAVRRALADRPTGLRGLAVPAMPVGAPGMEVPGRTPDTYEVIAFGDGAHRSFMRFHGGEPA